MTLPRAITFTGSFYSLGIPPEFLGISGLSKLKTNDFVLFDKYYKNHINNFTQAGHFLNWKNLNKLSQKSKNKNNIWQKIENDIKKAENIFKLKFGPENIEELMHSKLTSELLASKNNPKKVKKLIAETGILRKSLG